MDKVHGMSQSGNWETPPKMVADLAPLFPWDLDAAASRPNVCQNFYSSGVNGLSKEWCGLVWLNPPYGRRRLIDRWMEKARIEGSRPWTTVVCLPPVRTSTRWWQDNVPFADLVVFIRGRLHFVLPGHYGEHNGVLLWVDERTGPASFPSAFVVFGSLNRQQVVKLDSYGYTSMAIHDVDGMRDWLKAQRR